MNEQIAAMEDKLRAKTSENEKLKLSLNEALQKKAYLADLAAKVQAMEEDNASIKAQTENIELGNYSIIFWKLIQIIANV